MARDADGNFAPMTNTEMLAEVRELATGSIGAGAQVGDRVVIFSRPRIEWALLNYVIWHARAVSVTIYESSSADQVEWILQDSGATVALVDDDMLDACAGNIEHDNPARLGYTSGTSGRQKGRVITHLNLIWTIRQIMITEPEVVRCSNRMLTFLTLAHVLARVEQLTAVITVAFGGGIRPLSTGLADFRPTWLTVVPLVLEKVHDGDAQNAGAGLKGRIFYETWQVAKEIGTHRVAGTTPPWRLRLEPTAADTAVFGRVHKALGGERLFITSGDAPLHTDLVVFEGYWQYPEATAVAFDSEWFHSGDYGEIDDDNHVVITGSDRHRREQEHRPRPARDESGGASAGRPCHRQWRQSTFRGSTDHSQHSGDRNVGSREQSADGCAWPPGRRPCCRLRSRGRASTAVDAVNARVSRAELIRTLRVLPSDFTISSSELTPTIII